MTDEESDIDIKLSDKNDKIGDKIYNMFGYPSKIYYKDIEKLIQHFTEDESATVLDPMVGSGAAAIATARTSRDGVFNDGSVLSSFITKESVRDVNLETVDEHYKKIESELKPKIDDMFSTNCSCCGDDVVVRNTMESDIYKCPECNHTYPLYQNEADGKSKYKCPECDKEISLYSPDDKENMIERRKPVTKKYYCRGCSCDGGYSHEEEITQDEIDMWSKTVDKYEAKFEPWYPELKVKTGDWYTRDGGWPGFEKGSTVSELFTHRNLVVLGMIRQQIQDIEPEDIRKQLMFVLLSSLIRSSNRMYESSVVKTYYQIPSKGKVQNPWTVFERKYKNYKKAKEMIDSSNSNIEVSNTDARDLDFIEDNSCDFTFIDPPYGSQIGYYVLNEFYTAWMGQSEEIDDEVIIPMETDDNDEEAEEWKDMMKPIFSEISRVTKDDKYIVLVFHSTSSKIWNKLRDILYNEVGFEYVGYINKERGTTFHTNRISNTNVSTAYVVLKNTDNNNSEIEEGQLEDDHITYIVDRLVEYFEAGDVNKREARDEIVRIVNEQKLPKVPTSDQIDTILDRVIEELS